MYIFCMCLYLTDPAKVRDITISGVTTSEMTLAWRTEATSIQDMYKVRLVKFPYDIDINVHIMPALYVR